MTIYLDNHATTPCDPRVVEAMLPYFTEKYGNSASKTHSFGTEAADAVEKARAQVAALIGADPAEIVFTSGATESDNLAIQGIAGEVVTVATEHKAVLDTCKATHANTTVLGVDADGLVRLDELQKAITDRTTLVSVMAANNEIGVIQPIAEIGKICVQRGVVFHTDAAQAAGKIPLDVRTMDIHLLSLTAHKMYGPKGVGALYVRRRGPRVKLTPMMHGGGHEHGLRSGTLAVPLIVGFGRAAEIAADEMAGQASGLLALRERLRIGLFERLDHVRLNGHAEKRLPGNLHVSIAYVEIEGVLQAMPDIAVSSSAACTTATLQPSHVLRALGLSEDLAHNSIRFGIGRFNTMGEIDITLERVEKAVKRLRQLSPAYPGPRT